jgi:hypothetical protein
MDKELDKNLIAREHERDKLLSLSLEDLAKESGPNQYQRMRYEREIEGWEYVRMLRMGKTYADAARLARIEADDVVKNWKFRKVEQLTPNLPKNIE